MVDGNERSTKGKELLSCRNILWLMAFCGFAVNALLQGNVSLTIIAMVVPRPKAAIVARCEVNELVNSGPSDLWTNRSSASNFSTYNVILTNISSLELTRRDIRQHTDRYDWTEYQQGLALGGYYWIHWITHFLGGYFVHRYGTKFVFGWANLLNALLGFLTPICVRYHLYAFVAIRVVQGAFSGCAWPAMHNMTAKWIPLHDRNKFITSYLGSSIGTAIAFPLCAMLVNWFGWESVFYITSTFGVVWFIAWQYLAYDTPQQHPRITEAERTFILENLENSVSQSSTKNSVPWMAILTSGPVWITSIATAGAAWGLFTIMIEAPSYFNYVHGWNISAAGALAACPLVMRMLFSYAFSTFADWILLTNKMSKTRLRKFSMLVSSGIQSIMVLGLAFSGCHPILAIIFMVTGTAVSGAMVAGTMSTAMDLCPNYASVSFGMCTSMSALLAVVTPMVVGILTNKNQTIQQWRLVFVIGAAIPILTLIPFLIFIKAEAQPWNFVENIENCNQEELRKLRSNPDDAKYKNSTNDTLRKDTDGCHTQVDI